MLILIKLLWYLYIFIKNQFVAIFLFWIHNVKIFFILFLMYKFKSKMIFVLWELVYFLALKNGFRFWQEIGWKTRIFDVVQYCACGCFRVRAADSIVSYALCEFRYHSKQKGISTFDFFDWRKWKVNEQNYISYHDTLKVHDISKPKRLYAHMHNY